MSIFSALQAGVSGLTAQSSKLGTISDNIANSSTTGYKRADQAFASLVVNSRVSSTFDAGGVTSETVYDITQQGGIVASTSATDLAISGGGFFVVTEAPDPDPADEVVPTGADDFAFTRAGSFTVDENGFLRNPQGFYLQAFRTDAEGNVIDPTGAIIDPVRTSTEDLQAVNVGNFTFTGEATENVIVAGNIDSDVIATNDPAQFFPTTIPYVNSLGGQEAVDAQIIPNPSSGPASANQDATVVLDFGPGQTTSQTVSFEIVFDANGTPLSYGTATATGADITVLTQPSSAGSAGVLQVSFDDDNGNPQTVEFEFGAQGTTEGLVISDQSSSVIADSDGALAAPLAGVEVDEEGRVFAIFENGEQVQQYLVPLARFTNPDGLNPETGTIFTQSGDSGSFFLANPGDSGVGTIAPSALESSNADLGEELTDLIVTQRIYSANTSVIQTADQMLQELTQIR